MKNNKYKILVLSDLKEKSSQILNYATRLSKEIDANVELFYVKEASEVAQIGNPLSAMRVLSEVSTKIDKKVKHLVTPISEKNNIKIKTSYAFGNIKSEIKNCISISQPDLIILGERKQKRFNLFGNNVSRLVNKNYEGHIVVATDEIISDSRGKVSLDNLGLKNNIANYNVKVKDELTA